MTSKPATFTTSDELLAQIGSLMEANAQLQRSCSALLAQIAAGQARQQHSQLPVAHQKFMFEHTPLSRIDSIPEVPQSARASILGAGVPIPHRPYKGDPRLKVLANTKARLYHDGWPDCEDTDMHASRLTEAMLRLGMEDLDNFTTEASRLNCSNMAITATLVSSIVATFVADTFSNNSSTYMKVVNALWFSSLFLSLAVATLCMLVSEWLTWSTSQELRDASVLYRLVRTAFRSALMHFSIFLFFAGIFILMWNTSDVAVSVVPTILLGLYLVYYVCATLRAPVFTFFGGVKQWDESDFRGLRVQIWTPFSLGSHHTFVFIQRHVLLPLFRLFNALPPPSTHQQQPEMASIKVLEHQPTRPSQEKGTPVDLHSLAHESVSPGAENEHEEVDPDEIHQTEAFTERMRNIRLRRLAEFEMHMRPGQRIKRVLKGDDEKEDAKEVESVKSAEVIEPHADIQSDKRSM